MTLSPFESEHYARLNDWEKPSFLRRLERMTERERNQWNQYRAILIGVLSATDAANRGEEHPRLNQMMRRTKEKRTAECARLAAYYPPRPAHLATPLKQHHGVYPENTKGRYLGD